MDPIKVLCVENYAARLSVIRHMLERTGYEVVGASTGKEAMGLFTSEVVDGVLLEYDLPDMSGARVRTKMKYMKPDVPVLLFSGIGPHIPILLRFFDAYLRHTGPPKAALDSLSP
jgi:CheY-like chemotaxis protein